MVKVYFISGHLDITPEQWHNEYFDRIEQAITDGDSFVVGEARGVDRMSIEHLWKRGLDSSRVTIYHLFDSPRYNPEDYFGTRGGFSREKERDEAMTMDSDEDIAWVRSEEETRKLYGKKYRPGRISGTQRNIDRRNTVMKIV